MNKCAAFSPDGKHLACGGCETTTNAGADILIYEFATGKLVREMRAPQRRIVSLTFSPDGKTLFSQGPLHQPKLLDGRRLVYDHVVRVWDVATGKERRSVLAGLGVEHLALSPDGRTLAHNGPAGRNAIILRETATGGERAKLTGPDNLILLSNKWVFGLAFSPDGRTVASAGADDGTVRLWNLLSGKEVGRLAAHRGSVETIAFSSDGRMLVSGGEDGTAHIWDVSKITGRPWGSAERSAAELEVDWKDLGGNAAKGYAALGRLVSSPVSAVPFLGKRLEAAVATAAETKPIERLIGKLDDKKFQVREQATKELEAMGDRATPSLRKALAGKPSPEARRRLGELLMRADGAAPSAETMCEVRAVEVLEAIGTPGARKLLDTLAARPSGMRLAEEAKASADRLAKRASIRP